MPKDIFHIDEVLAVPKYRQIINSIYTGLESGILKQGDKIPSINSICKEFGLSRDTVLMAFNELKSKGVISSIPGKGYYIESTDTLVEQKLFVLFDELNGFKEDLYSSFINSLNPNIIVDIYFHHFNYKVFKDLIYENAGKFTSYIIMPATFDRSSDVISILPQERVYILDRMKPDLENYPVIYQDFEADVYENMLAGQDLLSKYEKIIMVFPGGKEPIERTYGFTRFCEEFGKKFEIIKSLENRKIKKGEAYLVASDRNLVHLIKKTNKLGFELGVDIGIISFNDTVLKEVVSNGITTISTDFFDMGKKLAKMVVNKEKLQLRNSSHLIRRNSL